ncbi:MAG: hypothetical protein GY953_31345 [bacterium]|nr:hypothetical protein [bacterium]
MSLKIFHLVFVALSILMAVLVGGWGFNRYLADGGSGNLTLGVGFFLAGAVLLVYGVKVLRKFREIVR